MGEIKDAPIISHAIQWETKITRIGFSDTRLIII